MKNKLLAFMALDDGTEEPNEFSGEIIVKGFLFVVISLLSSLSLNDIVLSMLKVVFDHLEDFALRLLFFGSQSNIAGKVRLIVRRAENKERIPLRRVVLSDKQTRHKECEDPSRHDKS